MTVEMCLNSCHNLGLNGYPYQYAAVMCAFQRLGRHHFTELTAEVYQPWRCVLLRDDARAWLSLS